MVDPATGVQELLEAVDTGRELLVTPDNQLGPMSRLVKGGLAKSCDGWSSAPPSTLATPVGRSMAQLCKPYWDEQGNPGPTEEEPFTGGQCPIGYQINASGQNSGFGPTSTVTFLNGPLRGPQVVPSGSILGDGSPGFRAVMFGEGESSTIISAVNMTKADADTWQVDSVTPLNGAQDNCGNPPPVVRPGNGPVYNYGDNVTYIDSQDGTEININVEAPTVNIDGRINLPITIGDLILNGLGGPSEGSPGGEPPPVDAGPEIPGDELGGDDGEFPPPPEGQEWVGAVLRLESDPPGQPPLPNSAASPVYPRIYGNFRLKLQSANGVGFLSENSPIREREQSLIRQSEGLTVTGARVNLADSSIQYVVIPLSALKPGE